MGGIGKTEWTVFFRFKDHSIIDACQKVIRVFTPFTEDHNYGKGGTAKHEAGS
jgi:hypothetical protein